VHRPAPSRLLRRAGPHLVRPAGQELGPGREGQGDQPAAGGHRHRQEVGGRRHQGGRRGDHHGPERLMTDSTTDSTTEAAAAATRTAVPRARRPPLAPRRRRRGALAPYTLSAPALLVLIGVLGYPLVRLLILSFQQWGLAQIFSG